MNQGQRQVNGTAIAGGRQQSFSTSETRNFGVDFVTTEIVPDTLDPKLILKCGISTWISDIRILIVFGIFKFVSKLQVFDHVYDKLKCQNRDVNSFPAEIYTKTFKFQCCFTVGQISGFLPS